MGGGDGALGGGGDGLGGGGDRGLGGGGGGGEGGGGDGLVGGGLGGGGDGGGGGGGHSLQVLWQFALQYNSTSDFALPSKAALHVAQAVLTWSQTLLTPLRLL